MSAGKPTNKKPAEECGMSAIDPLGVFNKFKNLIYYYIKLFKIQARDSDDIAQEVFIRILENKKMLHQVKNLKYWVNALTKNIILDRFRKNKRDEMLNSNLQNRSRNIIQKRFQGEIFWGSEQELYEREALSIVTEILANIDERFGVPFWLRNVEGLRWKEISQCLGISVDTARKRARRALEILNGRFEKHFALLRRREPIGAGATPANE